jgi:hypothetical protein
MRFTLGDRRERETRKMRSLSKILTTGEPDDLETVKSGSGGGGWKRTQSVTRLTGTRTPTSDDTSPAAYPTAS